MFLLAARNLDDLFNSAVLPAGKLIGTWSIATTVGVQVLAQEQKKPVRPSKVSRCTFEYSVFVLTKPPYDITFFLPALLLTVCCLLSSVQLNLAIHFRADVLKYNQKSQRMFEQNSAIWKLQPHRPPGVCRSSAVPQGVQKH